MGRCWRFGLLGFMGQFVVGGPSFPSGGVGGHFVAGGVGVDSLVHGFGLRSSCGLSFDFGLKSGCDRNGRLWVVGKLLSSCFILFFFIIIFLPCLLSWEERGLSVLVALATCKNKKKE